MRAASDTARKMCHRYSRACVTSPMYAKFGAPPRWRQAARPGEAEDVSRGSSSGSFCRCDQLLGIQRAFGRVFVLEVDVDVAAFDEIGNGRSDERSLRWGIRLLAQPQICKVRSLDSRSFQFFALCVAQCHVRLAQGLVNVVAEPGRVPELECRTDVARNCGEEILEQPNICLQVRRQLKQHRPELSFGGKRLQRAQKVRREVSNILQPAYMRDFLICLYRELKLRRSCADP